MGMTEEQIEQARRSLESDEVVDGEFEEVETLQPPPAAPDSPSALLTLLIAPVAGYLVAFAATTWFDLSLTALVALAVVVVFLLSRRFFTGFAGLLGLVLFAGVASAYRVQDTPVIAQYAAPYIAMIDGDYLCKAVVCQRRRPMATDSKAEFLALWEARISGVGHGEAIASNPAAASNGGQVQPSGEELAAVRALQAAERAEQARLAAAATQERERLAEEERQRQYAAQLRQQQIAEERRQAEELRREREAEEQKDRNYRAAISNFEFPSSNCRRPAVPSTDASDYVLTRFDNAADDYSDCVASAIRRDERAVASLVAELDGDFDAVDGGYHASVWERFSEPVQDIIDTLVDRNDRRVQRHNELADAIDRRNERVTREEYWAGIQESVDRFEYEMEQQRQNAWNTWNNNNVYVSPGYH